MENIGFGLNVTLVGMGLVFALLAVLWGLLSIITAFDRTEVTSKPPSEITVLSPAEPLDADTLAAVAVAVLAHTAARRRQAAPAMRSAWPGSQMYASRWLAAGRTRQTLSWFRKR